MTAEACSDDPGRRARLVRAALLWRGTPYRHQASCRGAGTDCLGLIRGVWREVIGPEPFTPPPYSADWSEADADETLLTGARRWMRERPLDQAEAGDVVVMRMRERAAAKHMGLLTEVGGPEPRMIHAYSGRGVVLSSIGASWRSRIVAAFSFPER
ncbi:MAG: NlpC/P60 family protein [Pseudomonadota bacterium]